VPHTGGQDLVGLDALVGGFVVVDEQCLVEQEATGRAAAGEARWRPLERGATQFVAGRLEALGDAGQFRAGGRVGDCLPEPGQPLGVEPMAAGPDAEELGVRRAKKPLTARRRSPSQNQKSMWSL
jgi:hypothetical protein